MLNFYKISIAFAIISYVYGNGKIDDKCKWILWNFFNRIISIYYLGYVDVRIYDHKNKWSYAVSLRKFATVTAVNFSSRFHDFSKKKNFMELSCILVTHLKSDFFPYRSCSMHQIKNIYKRIYHHNSNNWNALQREKYFFEFLREKWPLRFDHFISRK